MAGRRFRRIGATLVAVVGLTFIAGLATGEVKLVTTHGISMEPRFHTGDLAVVVPSTQYRVGEIVGYHSPLLHIVVLHRIVAEHGGLFTFKGDNNSFLDPRRLPAAAIEGRLWLHIPRGGTVLGWFRSPVVLGVLAFLIVLLGGAGGASRRRVRGPGSGVPHPLASEDTPGPEVMSGFVAKSMSPSAQPLYWWPVGLPLLMAAAFGMLSITALAKPVTRPSVRPASYRQNITFSYGAKASPGVIYPAGSVISPEPVFIHLVKTLDVQARYEFAAAPGGPVGKPTHLSGTIGGQAVLNGPEGWQSPLSTVTPIRFAGRSASIDIPIDLSRISALEAAFARETGSPLDTPVVTVIPSVRIHGTFDGVPLAGHLAPSLPFQTNGEVLNLASTGGNSPANFPELTSHLTGSVAYGVRVPVTISALGRSMSVTTARRVGLIGMGALMMLALAGGLWVARRRRMDEPERIRAAYGHELVSVSTSPAARAPLVVDVETFDQLARLARRYDCLILEYSGPASHAYYVESGTTVYRCGVEPSTELGLLCVHDTDPVGPFVPMRTPDDALREPGQPAAMSRGPFSGASWPMATAEEGLLVPGSFLRPRGRRGRLRTGRADASVDVASEVDLLTCLARAEWVSGVGDARGHLSEALIMARKAGTGRAMVEALSVNVLTSLDAEQEADGEMVGLSEHCLESLDGAPALRARILGALAVGLIATGDTTRGGPILDQARALVRTSGDPTAHVDVAACTFLARPRSSWSLADIESDRQMCAEAVDVATSVDDPLRVATIQVCSASYAMVVGDGGPLRSLVSSLSKSSMGGQNQVALRGRLRFEQSIATLEGHLDEAEALAIKADAAESGAHLGSLGTEGAKRQLALRREQDRLEELIPLFTLHQTISPHHVTPGAVLAYLAAETGEVQESSTRLRRVMDSGIGNIPADRDWPFVMALLAETAVAVGDRDAAATLHEIITTQDGMQMWTSGVYCGPAARLLAALENTLGWIDHADWHFNEAVESSRRFGSPVWSARCQLDWAATWIERGEIVRAVQLIYGADDAMQNLELPALQRRSSRLKHQLDPR